MWALFMLPWVRKLAGVLLALAALAAVIFAIYHAGLHAGAQAEAGKQVEAGHQQFDQLQKSFTEERAAGRAREEQLGQLAVKFADLATAAASRVDTARRMSIADTAKVQALPDSAVKADLEAKAGGPLEDPRILRHVDDVVTDYPHKVEEANAAGDEISAVNSRFETATSQLANMTAERDSAIRAFNQLLPLYTQAYNAAIVGHRRWFCLFLCKRKNTMALPTPASLTVVPS